jgi:hypothetical protein
VTSTRGSAQQINVAVAAKSVSQGMLESQLGDDDEVGVEHIEAGQNQ